MESRGSKMGSARLILIGPPYVDRNTDSLFRRAVGIAWTARGARLDVDDFRRGEAPYAVDTGSQCLTFVAVRPPRFCT